MYVHWQFRPCDAGRQFWARHPGRLPSGLQPHRRSDICLGPPRTQAPGYITRVGFCREGSGGPHRILTGPGSTISWEYRFWEQTNPRVVNPVIDSLWDGQFQARNLPIVERVPGWGVTGLQISGFIQHILVAWMYFPLRHRQGEGVS